MQKQDIEVVIDYACQLNNSKSIILVESSYSESLVLLLATIKKADKIIVMDKGLIVEQGSHEELLLLKGNYYNLYEMQFAQS